MIVGVTVLTQIRALFVSCSQESTQCSVSTFRSAELQ